MATVHDPYGEMEFGDWEDPYNHVLLTMCTGCPMCVNWEGRTYEEIRAQRLALISRRRLAASPEQTTDEVGQEDRDHWSQRYAG